MITFHSEEIDYELPQQDQIAEWLVSIAALHKSSIESFDIIFCSDQYMLDLNKRVFEHDYFTDVITLPLLSGEVIRADSFISVDRVKENAVLHNNGMTIDEMHRVIVHSLLHCIGFDDRDPVDKQEMTRQENIALSLRRF